MSVAYDASLVSPLDDTAAQRLPGQQPHRSADRSRRTSRPVGRRAALALAFVCAVAGCDTGDGKVLPEPTGTVAPPTVPPSSTDPVRDGVGTLASLPIEPPPTGVELPAPVGDFAITAPWLEGAPIDVINTCDGQDLSPALSWTAVPAGTVELAFVMADESVGDGTPFIHWVMAGINPNEISLIEGDMPAGSILGVNSFGNLRYDGPCPPSGDAAHVYRITVYALSQQVELADGSPAEDLIGFIQNVALASADATGTFAR